MSAPDGAGLRVGLDLVSVDEVSASVARFGERYLRRIYTEHELACCARSDGGPDTYDMDSLAARFAAKEATIKVLRPVGSQPEWRSMELHRMAGGWCELRLSGLAAELAADAGIEDLAVSVSHEAAVAAAVVVGRCRTRERGIE